MKEACYNKKICIVCGREFHIAKNKNRNRPSGVRRGGSLTCSSKCSRIYNSGEWRNEKNSR